VFAIDAPAEARVIGRNRAPGTTRIASFVSARGVSAIAARPVIGGTYVRSIHTRVWTISDDAGSP
jgi:hypothetical protein